MAILIFIPVAYSVELKIEPAELFFDKVLDYSEKYFTLTSDEAVKVSFSTAGPIKSWLSFEPRNSIIAANSQVEIKAIVQPQTAILGVHEGFIIVNLVPMANEITAISTTTSLKTKVDITDQRIKQAFVRELSINDIEENEPINVKMEIENKGNVLISPIGKIRILDENKQEINSHDIQESEILPYAIKDIEVNIDSNLPVGQYWADIGVFSNDLFLSQQTLSFEVLEPGTKKAEPLPEPEQEIVPLSTGPTIIVLALIILMLIARWFLKHKAT